ncbi:right-handed parallel beta-helix repeat-containing protein [Microbacterium sp. CIAB417]|uniref:right-handed parallel beta-helix repeat-containing protein n=1 Tax=Microbacterium sp. CIAB417 TaxID=2860287 RepID=UPI001FAD30B2|nr:right-handed parallel beta-helix repeat-containing protein [Microbacterium sp. CIAB417]
MSTDRIEVHVAPDGSPYADGSRGYPANDLEHGLRLVRARREPGQRAVIWMSGGEYPHAEPVVFTGGDSFTSVVARDADDPPLLRGSVRISGWRPVSVNGVQAWAAPAPRTGGRRLYVGGVAAPRPRFPRDGFLRVEEQDGLDPAGSFVGTLFDGAASFRYVDGDIPELAQPEAVEVVVPHYWVQERMPITAIDRETRTVTSSLRSIFALRDDAAALFARYYLDNVAESFGEVPGEWYLDATGALAGASGPHVLYLPLEGQDMTDLDVRMPVTDAFVELAGTAQDPVREVRFEGIRFAEADFASVPPAMPPFGVREDPQLPADGRYAADVQAASTVPAALRFTHARSCALIGGAVERVGGYALSLGAGSRGTLVSGVRFTDLGAGAVRSGGGIDALGPDYNQANEVSDCLIERGGQVYPNTVAVLFQHGSHNVIAHNEIRDFFYSGISVGWMWDYLHSPSEGNRIEGNHIHDLGKGLLNDMGGVYLLGIAPGTVVRGNHIHDVECANYGGWGIYLDEGSSHVVIEQNVVHDVSSQSYHQHYGREVMIRDNIWAYGRSGQVSITRPEEHVSFTFHRNIVVSEGMPAFVGYPDHRDIRNFGIDSDLNLFWDATPIPGAERAANAARETRADGSVGFEIVEPLDDEWARLGHDRHSVTADPLFLDAESRDLRVRPGSPVDALGIRVPDVSTAGPRPTRERRHPLAAPTLPDPFRPIEG